MSHDTTRLLALTSMSPLSGPAYGLREIAARLGVEENADRLGILIATHPRAVARAIGTAEWNAATQVIVFGGNPKPDLSDFIESLEVQP
jgi:hypothetical protein